jgi:hypothetical protein
VAIRLCRILPSAAVLSAVAAAALAFCANCAVPQSQPSTAKPRPGPACIPLAEITAQPVEPEQPDANAPSTPRPAQLRPDPVQSNPVQPNLVQLNQDICIRAHVYDVVELSDGTRFLDVCPAALPDQQCRFALVSLAADREEVGDLRRYRDQDIRLRGTLRRMHGRMGLVISHARQFSGGPEKFKPNPRLLRNFNAQSDQMPIRDPNLAPAGRHRSFMNTQDKVQDRETPSKP